MQTHLVDLQQLFLPIVSNITENPVCSQTAPPESLSPIYPHLHQASSETYLMYKRLKEIQCKINQLSTQTPIATLQMITLTYHYSPYFQIDHTCNIPFWSCNLVGLILKKLCVMPIQVL